MTYLRETAITLADSPAADAAGRLRVSEPTTLFASFHEYTDSPEWWETTLAGNGTSTHVPAEAAVRLRTTTTNGDSAIRQTYRYFRYLPGASHLIILTCVVGPSLTNVRKRWGYFDAGNGLFFEQSGGTLHVVRRSSVSGSPVDVAIAQASWNLDKLDGTGPSGITLDPTKGNIYVIDFLWLGMSRVRMGVMIDGKVVYCHEFLNANTLSTVWASTANLPLRYEITNTGTASGSTNDFMQVCSTVKSEGGAESALLSRLRSAATGITPVAVSTRRAVMSIRPKSTYGGRVNRALIRPYAVTALNTGNQPVYVEIVRGGTLGGTPAWTSVSTTSVVEWDRAGTTVTDGEILWSGFLTAGTSGGGRLDVPFEGLTTADVPLTLNAAGASPTVLSLVATAISGTMNVYASMGWRETY